MKNLRLRLNHLIRETSQKVDESELDSFSYYIAQGKLKAYQNLSREIDENISQGISQDNLTFIRVVDDKGKQHLFPVDKIDYVNADTELLTIYVIVQSGESYGIFFDDDEKFQLQLDYLHRQLNIQ